MKAINVFRGIGEFPQCFLGWILIHIYNVEYVETYKDIAVYKGDFPGGISLGLYIIMNKYSTTNTKKHEGGHTEQSLRGGWLYLLTVGLVSISWCGLQRISKKLRQKDYYSVGPENKADEYGGVRRYE